MWSHCFMELKERQQEEEEMLEATLFALMITLEAKWWPSCLGSVFVCENLIKIIIITMLLLGGGLDNLHLEWECRRENWEVLTECPLRSRQIWLKGIQDSSEGRWERLLTVLTSTQIPLKSLNITLIKSCATTYTNSSWSISQCSCIVWWRHTLFHAPDQHQGLFTNLQIPLQRWIKLISSKRSRSKSI